jgi:hypothetical protein
MEYFKILKKRLILSSSIANQWNETITKEKETFLFKQACQEWDIIESEEGIGDINFKYEGTDDKCLCTHDIVKKRHIINKISGLTAHVGSDCILRFDNEELIKKYKESLKTFCDVCQKAYVKIDSHYKSQKHIDNKSRRKCKGCTHIFPKDTEHWKIYCVPCYKIHGPKTYNKYKSNNYKNNSY